MSGLWRRLGTPGFALWLGLVAALLLEHGAIAGSGGTEAPPWWSSMIGATGIAAAVALRRPHPVFSLVMSVGMVEAALLAHITTGRPVLISYVVVLSVVSWLAGRHSGRVRGFTAVVVAGNLLLLPLGVPLLDDRPVSEAILDWSFLVLQSLILVVLPWLLGRYRRQQAQLASAGWELAERMEHEQQLNVTQARLRERARIAQDMHDSLGHELSLIALRSGALEVTPDLAQRHRAAATELRISAATATERLGEIIGVLRDQEARAPLGPADESVGDLVERASASGLEVRLVTDGAGTSVPGVVQQSVHRIVQEALTNASKHAPGAPVTVQVRHGGDATRVRVGNGPAIRAPAATSASGGLGLPGLEQRARLLGGSLTAGRRPDGGYAVDARIPHATAAAVEPMRSESEVALESARSRARRGLVVAVATPLALGGVFGLLILGYYVVIGYSSVLEPSDYDRLHVGQSRGEVEPVLPPMQMLDDPADDDVARPTGSTCEFYRPDGPFSITYAYRLCFAGDRLAAKDVIRTGAAPVEEDR